MKFIEAEEINNTTVSVPEPTPAEAAPAAAEQAPALDPTSRAEQEKQFEQNYDPFSAPAGLFGLYGPRFLGLVENKLSNKSLRRVLKSLVMLPLEPLHPNKNNKEEVEAYQIGHKMLEAKYLMMLFSAHQAEEKRRLEQQALSDASTAAAKAIEASSNEPVSTETTEPLKGN